MCSAQHVLLNILPLCRAFQVCYSGFFRIILRWFQLTLLLMKSIIFTFTISCNPTIVFTFQNFRLLSWTYISWNFHVYEQTPYFLLTPILIFGLMLHTVLRACTCLLRNVVIVSWFVPTDFVHVNTSFYFLILLPFPWNWWSELDHTIMSIYRSFFVNIWYAIIIIIIIIIIISFMQGLYTRAVQWKTGKVVLKIACKTDVIVCRVCEGGDLELPIDGIGTPATRIGTWETVRQDGGALATVHQKAFIFKHL